MNDKQPYHYVITSCFVLLWVFFPLSPLIAQQNCDDAIEDATQFFNLGQFEKLLKRIDGCYGKFENNVRQNRIEAHKLKAKSYLAMDRQEQAKLEIYKLLGLSPIYNPSPVTNSKLFIDLVNLVRLEMVEGTVSSVSKKAENAAYTPADLVVITAEQIKQRGYKDIEEIFHDLAGFDVSRSWGFSYSNIYQRGYRSAANTDRTLILVNGVEDNSLFSNTAFISRQYPLSNIKRIEIINGPASTMYGANAFLGVINIITKGEQDLFKGNNKVAISGQALTGSYNTHYGDITLGVKNDRIALTLTGRYHTSQERDLSQGSDNPNDPLFKFWNYEWDDLEWDVNHYRSALTIPNTTTNLSTLDSLDPSQILFAISDTNLVPTDLAIAQARAMDSSLYQSVFGSPNDYYNASENYYIGGQLRIDDLKIGFATWKNRAGIAIGSDNFFAGDTNNTWASTQSYLSLRYDKYLSDQLSISSFTRFKVTTTPNDTRVISLKSFGNGGRSLKNLLAGQTTNWETIAYYRYSNQVRSELSTVYYPSSKFNAILGVEYRRSNLQGVSLTKKTVSDTLFSAQDNGTYELLNGGNNFIVQDIGAYYQMTYKPMDSLYLTAGIRVDNNTVRSGGYGTEESTRLAAVYKNKSIILKVLFTEAIKDASVFQRFETNATRIPNPDLDPERVNNYEISIKYQPSSNFYFQTLFYDADYSNILTQQQIDGKDQFVASGQWQIRGIVARMAYKTGDLNFYANYTYSNPVNITDPTTLVGDIAKHQINIGANGSFFKNRLNINLRGNYVGSKSTVITNPLVEIPAYLIFYSAITAQNIKYLPGWSLQLTVNNILDNNILDSNTREYYHPGIREASNTPYVAAMPQNRRNLWVKLYYDF